MQHAHVLVRFSDDRELLHHRVLVGTVRGKLHEYFWLTPQRDVVKVDLQGANIVEIIPITGTRCSNGVRKRDCYLDVHSERGPFSRAELRAIDRPCQDPVPVEAPPPEPRAPSEPAPPRRRISEKRAPGPEYVEEGVGGEPPASDPDAVWLAMVGVDGLAPGEEVVLGSTSVSMGRYVLFRRGAHPILTPSVIRIRIRIPVRIRMRIRICWR